MKINYKQLVVEGLFVIFFGGAQLFINRLILEFRHYHLFKNINYDSASAAAVMDYSSRLQGGEQLLSYAMAAVWLLALSVCFGFQTTKVTKVMVVLIIAFRFLNMSGLH